MECPYIDKSIEPSAFNKPLNYKDFGGDTDYAFWDHDDGFGKITRVQFCTRIGRKTDVFECFNENEWKHCHAYSLNWSL